MKINRLFSTLWFAYFFGWFLVIIDRGFFTAFLGFNFSTSIVNDCIFILGGIVLTFFNAMYILCVYNMLKRL